MNCILVEVTIQEEIKHSLLDLTEQFCCRSQMAGHPSGNKFQQLKLEVIKLLSILV